MKLSGLLTPIFILFHVFLFSQTTVKGLIVDASTNKAIPFTSIGIIGKNIGTLSNEDGNFEFTFTSLYKNDSLKIFSIGYKPLTYLVSDFIKETTKTIKLQNLPTQLEEVVVNSKKIKYKVLGTTNYTKNNCSGFVKNETNWKGSETAIIAGNKSGRTVLVETFSFYVIQNKYADSLKFRLMFYEASEKGYPRFKTILRKPIIFKMGTKQGEFTLNLREYNISTPTDFFISLECLMDEMDIAKFCYAGSNAIPSFVKAAAFSRWYKIRGGGADFNVKVSYKD